MGRWSYSNKTEADYLKKVEIWWLKKYGYLNGWKSGGIEWKNKGSDTKSSISIEGSIMDGDNYIRFQYTMTDRDTGEKKEFDYKVRLATTPCNYGGIRYWFICPLSKSGVYCGRRVGVLYMAGNYFGCRHCYDLTYSSKKENRNYRLYYLFRILDVETRIEKIRENMKHSFYAGKPTKKLQRIMRLHQGVEPYTETLRENERKGII